MPEEPQLKEDKGYLSQQQKKQKEFAKKKFEQVKKKTQNVFIALSTIVIGGTIICIPKFYAFRDYCHQNGIYVISPVAFIWAALGYAFNWYTRQWWDRLMTERFRPLMHPRNAYKSKDAQQDKIASVIKQSYDFIYHTAVTIILLVLFRSQDWFPVCMGGVGSCDSIFSSYPSWSQTLNPQVQILYLFQLGTNLYNLLDLMYFRREQYKYTSFYELMFHHFVATILIIFSISYNLVPIGTMVMFVHDSSDAVRGLARVVSECKYAIEWMRLSKFLDTLYFVVWGYMRILVLPLCLINSMYDKYFACPVDLQFLYMQHIYLIGLVFGIYFLHSYWVFFLFRGNLLQWKQNEQFIKWRAEQQQKGSSKDNKKE